MRTRQDMFPRPSDGHKRDGRRGLGHESQRRAYQDRQQRIMTAKRHHSGKPRLLPQQFDPGHHHFDSEENQPQSQPEEQICSVSLVFCQVHRDSAQPDKKHGGHGNIQGDDKHQNAIPDEKSIQDSDRLRDIKYPDTNQACQNHQRR